MKQKTKFLGSGCYGAVIVVSLMGSLKGERAD